MKVLHAIFRDGEAASQMNMQVEVILAHRPSRHRQGRIV